MNQSYSQLFNDGSTMIREYKKRMKEIFIRIRIESYEVVLVNKEETVLIDLHQIVDLRNSDGKSLLSMNKEKYTESIHTTRENDALGFKFIIYYGLTFKLKKIVLRAPNTTIYTEWINGLKHYLMNSKNLLYKNRRERWLWKQYYELGNSLTINKNDWNIEPTTVTKCSSNIDLRDIDDVMYDPQVMDRRRYNSAFSDSDEENNHLQAFRNDFQNKQLYKFKVSRKNIQTWFGQISMKKLPSDIVSKFSSNYPPKPKYIDFSGFANIYAELFLRTEVFLQELKSFLKHITPLDSVLMLEQWSLEKVCKLKSICNIENLNELDKEWIESIFNYSFDESKQIGSVDDLFNYENCIWDVRRECQVYQNMDRPLSMYFIATSHNTYLYGDQIKSQSSTEAYVRSLQMNCRCIELDCWNGDKDPIIYHGNTLTTKIKLIDTLHKIKSFAWEYSKYPLILSIEDHCNILQQVIIAQYMQEVFKDDLLVKKIEDVENKNLLPSPNQLKNKVILKHRQLPMDMPTDEDGLDVVTNGGLTNNPENRSESGYIYCDRIYMKNTFFDIWIPYLFLLTGKSRLYYTEDDNVAISLLPITEVDADSHTSLNSISLSGDTDQEGSERIFTDGDTNKLFEQCKAIEMIEKELNTERKSNYPWLFGYLTRTQAEQILLHYCFYGNGLFLIRVSENDKVDYILSIYIEQKVLHIGVNKMKDDFNNKTFVFLDSNNHFTSLENLVKYYQKNEILALDFNIRLTKPPPKRFYVRNCYYYDNLDIQKETVENMLQHSLVTGSFLVRRQNNDAPFPNDNFVLSYRMTTTKINHVDIQYDGFNYSLFGKSKSRIVDLIQYFRFNKMPDGIKLHDPVYFSIIKKCQEKQKNLWNRTRMNKETNMNIVGGVNFGCFQFDSDSTIHSGEINIAIDNSDKKLYRFVVIQSKYNRRLEFACESEESRDIWLNQLTKACYGSNCSDSSNCDDIDSSARNSNEKQLKNVRQQELQFNVAKQLSSLIVYCSAVRFCWPEEQSDFERLVASSCHKMSSISESKFLKLVQQSPNSDNSEDNSQPLTESLKTKCLSNTNCILTSSMSPTKNTNNMTISISPSAIQRFQCYHQFHLTRVYPKLSRIYSTNFSPILPWYSGVQMAAINYQTPDRGMQINQAMFRDNGGCGYIERTCDIFFAPYALIIKLSYLTSRHLPKINKGYLHIELISGKSDTDQKFQFLLENDFTVADNHARELVFKISDIDLTFIRFAYGSKDGLSQKKTINCYQAIFPVRGIRPGIRCVQLRNGYSFVDKLSVLLFFVQVQLYSSIDREQ